MNGNIDAEMAKAFTEILEILKYVSRDYYNKVPKDILETFEESKDESYVFLYDTHKRLIEQNISPQTSGLIAYLYKNYWATPKEREEYLIKYNQYLKEEKLKQYDKMLDDDEE